ncbi:metal-dependent hydrolase [Paenibacillus caui]|uniref:metal-dependent hydrolase n=1 Tax=Paenibacillus caui TaxID=2873927 RepID=UPI001CA7CA72|nr:metal-dependent hydrolase [Paenibacillus caui]
MKGSTHLAIGCAVGAAAVGYHSFNVSNSLVYIAAAAISSLCPDLDGPSMLSSRISKASRTLYRSLITLAVLMTLLLIYLYAQYRIFHPELTAATLCAILPSLILKEGVIRNTLVSLVGAAVAGAGLLPGMTWLSGFGIFVMIAPWLKHRGMTHTIWALLIWYLLSQGMERQLGIDGIALTAAAGYASHLVADTLTSSGVKWLYPLSRITFKLPFRR